ncbi:MAG: MBL fold metallo-hydrolase [Chloroflexi bacterium]|nr:MBL fold metallo-hydrolase [Chloroflexota bacterium]
MQEIAENIFIETGYDGVNVAAVRTRRGVIAIDVPSYPRQARDWAMRLHALTPRNIQYIILTDYHGDRIINARWLNAPIIAHEATADKLRGYDKRYPHILLESLTSRNSENGRELSQSPVEKASMSFSEVMHMWKGGIEFQLFALPGPTEGNIGIYLPKTKVLFTGDVVVTEMPPLLAEANTEAWLQTIHKIQNWPDPIKQVVPGRGEPCSLDALTAVSDYIQTMRQRIQEHVDTLQPREEIHSFLPEFADRYPNTSLPADWLKKQIKLSLDRVYDELQLPIEEEI